MTDELVTQIHRYTRGHLDIPQRVRVDELIGSKRARRPTRRLVAAATGIALVVASVTTVALVQGSTNSDQPAPQVSPPSAVADAPTTWSSVGSPGEAQVFGLAVSAKGIVAGGYTMGYSSDGTSWQNPPVEDFGHVNDVIATPDGFLAVGASADKHAAAWTSSDGVEWHRADDPSLEPSTPPIPDGVSTPYGSINAVSATPLGYVAVGSVFDGQFVDGTLIGAPWKPTIWSSPDGVGWTRHDVPRWTRGTDLVGVTAIGRDVYVVGTDRGSSTIWHSDDTATWDQVSTLAGASINGITNLHGHLLAVGIVDPTDQSSTRPAIWYADTPTTWTIAYKAPHANVAALTHIVTNGSYALALGYTGKYEVTPDGLTLYSADGANWQPAVPDGQTFDCQTATPTTNCSATTSSGTGYATAATTYGTRFYTGLSEGADPHPADPPNMYRRRFAIFSSP